MSHWNNNIQSNTIIINKINDKDVNISAKIQANCVGWNIKILDAPNQNELSKELVDIILTEKHFSENDRYNSWNVMINGMRFDCRSFYVVRTRYIVLSLQCMFNNSDEYKDLANLGLSCGCE